MMFLSRIPEMLWSYLTDAFGYAERVDDFLDRNLWAMALVMVPTFFAALYAVFFLGVCHAA